MKINDPNQAPRGAQAEAPTVSSGPEVAFTRRERSSRSERIALFVTGGVGSLGFFAVVVAWTAVWLAWNSLAPRSLRFDSYPAFVLWLFLSNLVQLFLMPLILVGQNLQARAADKRAEADLAINRAAEKRVEELQRDVEEIRRMLQRAQSGGGRQDPSPGP